jgi:hypothetical protein
VIPEKPSIHTTQSLANTSNAPIDKLFYFYYHGSILIWDQEVAYSIRVALPACDN